MSFLIKDTTREQREQIVADSIGNIEGACDGCMPGIIEMYQDYIDGKRELREINMAFNRGYTSADHRIDRDDCGMQ
ncbi:MAG: purine biosynthesis protein PurH [Clostridiales bacterium]|nr:purine biosynthesis protein PurH [Clostridiales bacterium]